MKNKIFIFILLFTICSTKSMWFRSYTKKQTKKEPAHHQPMHNMYGNYPMTRQGSGTSWVPDSSPPEGFHFMHKDWIFMVSGFNNFVTDIQRGKRGGKQLFDSNMFMFMGQRDFGKSTIAFRTMFSFEPLTIGKKGYPLLLQTGETADGVTPLIDRQHPHDLFDEIAFVCTVRPTEQFSFFFYGGLPGEPAIGPPTYTMRFSSEYIPETPISHHWMDSTHITFGVITAGFVYKNIKFELCAFKGREPDQYRFDIEKPKLDSHSVRFSYNPTNDLALQLSYAFLHSPEQLSPNVNERRFTLSAIYNKKFDADESNLQATASIGIKKDYPGNLLPAFLLEATTEIRKKHVIFSRIENVKNDELFEKDANDPLHGKKFNVQKLTLGYIREFLSAHHLKWGFGALIDFPMMPGIVKERYGKTTSGMLFLQFRLI